MADDSSGGLLKKIGSITGVKKGPPKPENTLTPDQALKRLLDGNQRYYSSQSRARDFETARDASVAGQNPYASILACADSRVSPELCFDEDRGDLFVIRLAGNYVSLDVLASLEYGSAVLHTPLIMVLGHEDCGAVKAAIKAHEEYAEFPGHIQMITSNLSDAVRAGLRMRGEIVDATARENVILNVNRLKDSTPIIKKLYKEKKINIVGALFNLHSGEVEIISD
jgi:carbonic anhydrase